MNESPSYRGADAGSHPKTEYCDAEPVEVIRRTIVRSVVHNHDFANTSGLKAA
jgi:hypothetical protein